MSVKDNGVGLPAELRPGRGILNMQGRARELGASLEMVRRERSGTSVKLVLPVGQQAA